MLVRRVSGDYSWDPAVSNLDSILKLCSHEHLQCAARNGPRDSRPNEIGTVRYEPRIHRVMVWIVFLEERIECSESTLVCAPLIFGRAKMILL